MGYLVIHPFISNDRIKIPISYRLPFTLPDPTLAPDRITAYNTSSGSLKIKWSHLAEEYFQGEPIGYNVIYYPEDLEGNVGVVSVKFTTNKTTLTNLTVYTMYVINVSAVSSGGIGPASTIKAQTDAEGSINDNSMSQKVLGFFFNRLRKENVLYLNL